MIELIKSRFSCREFTQDKIKDNDLKEILECGRWAPSGLNNQPWRFVIIKEDQKLKRKLSELTSSGNVINGANVNIIVLLDVESIYSKTKDILSVGACIENMLIAIHALRYGACWLGEILNKSDQVLNLLKLDSKTYELLAVIALGVPKCREPEEARERVEMTKILLKSY
jgi:nitroreductase